MIFLPTFHLRGRRWRVRLRRHGIGWILCRRTDHYAAPQVVYSLWVGPLLLTAMVDDG